MARYKVCVSITTDYEFEFEFGGDDEDDARTHAEGLVQTKSMDELGAASFDGSFDVWNVELIE